MWHHKHSGMYSKTQLTATYIDQTQFHYTPPTIVTHTVKQEDNQSFVHNAVQSTITIDILDMKW